MLRILSRSRRSALVAPSPTCRRQLFGWGKKQASPPPTATILAEDNLFHPLSKSPFPQLVDFGKRIRTLAPCPVCLKSHDIRRAVRHECEDCGFPTHCSHEHWQQDNEHKKYCGRLRTANEDEHDVRSGRRIREFEMPGPQPSDETVSLANWDIFWYTRGFTSMDTDRQRRNASKLLTYPMSVAGTLHQHSSLTLRNQRVTPEGARSLAALRTVLHTPSGTPETQAAAINKPPMRIFIVGARAESSLPPHIWEQVCMLFPTAVFQLYFIGPEVSFPRHPDDPPTPSPPPQDSSSRSISAIWKPPAPPGFITRKTVRRMDAAYGVPSYHLAYSPQLSITGLQTNFSDVYPRFQDTFDPYTDAFFLFSPGFGFPSPTTDDCLQINSSAEWGPVIPQLLDSKCAIFVTGFSPTDVERDVRSLEGAEGVSGEFDWIVTPGSNPFGSEKWDIAEFDPRVMVKTNWGIWGIRGKRRDVKEGYLAL